MKRPIKVAPSLLSADFTRLEDEVRRVEQAGCDWLHVDVMDGHFVPNLTVGPFIVEAVRRTTRLPLDVHLMIERPERYLEAFAKAGADNLTVHAEACEGRLSRTLDEIRSLGPRVGVSLRPQTPLEAIEGLLDRIDLVLLMTVNPGFGGQAFMPEVLPKIRSLRERYAGDIEVDGGINRQTGPSVLEAGANVLVAGTAVFKSQDIEGTIRALRNGQGEGR